MLKRLFKLYIIFIFVLSLVFIYYLCNYVSEIHEIELIDEYINETKNDILVKEDNNKTIKATKTTTKKSNYLMVLEIPKINLKKGIYDKSNKLNNSHKSNRLLKLSETLDGAHTYRNNSRNYNNKDPTLFSEKKIVSK